MSQRKKLLGSPDSEVDSDSSSVFEAKKEPVFTANGTFQKSGTLQAQQVNSGDDDDSVHTPRKQSTSADVDKKENPEEDPEQSPHRESILRRLYHRLRYGRSYSPHEKIKRLPRKSRRYWAWKYEVLRPWEPHPPKNYYKLLHAENPWIDQPPSQLRLTFMLGFFLLYSILCAFLPWLANINVISHRETVLKQPAWMLPWWFNIFAAAFTHILCGVSIWFIYLTGGFRKHLRRMIPWFLMLACQAIWPDILFSWTWILGAVIVCILGWCLCTITAILFASRMGYAGILMAFYNAWLVYQSVVLMHIMDANGMTYSF